MVHKPAEWSPLTACLLAEIALDAGLPPGVLNVVHGMGETAGCALTENPDIAAIAFVGESVTGSAIQAQSAATLKRLHFELGGKNPVIVFDDADVDRALDAVAFMIYSLNGERCTSSSRLLVHHSIYDDFTQQLAAKLRNICVGHPLDPATVVGPLIHPRHCDKVRGYIELAAAEGATVVEGTPWDGAPADGNFVTPVLFIGPRTTCASPERRSSARPSPPSPSTTRPTRYRSPTTPTTDWPPTSGPATSAGPIGWPTRSMPAWFGSTPRTSATCPRRSGAPSAAASAATGATGSFDFYMETKNVAVAYDSHPIPKLGD